MLQVQDGTSFEAAGLRLVDGFDYPYYFTKGFDPDFVKKEMYLCALGQEGEMIRDSEGNPYLECMCGNVIEGRTDPSFAFSTQYGTFWTNSTSELLASTSEGERQARTRNRCNGEGYESVALVPVRSVKTTFGLLQLNDMEKLKGILPICSQCKKVRNGDNMWEQIETYIHDRSDARFTHTFCPDCYAKWVEKLEVENK